MQRERSQRKRSSYKRDGRGLGPAPTSAMVAGWGPLLQARWSRAGAHSYKRDGRGLEPAPTSAMVAGWGPLLQVRWERVPVRDST